MQGVNLGEAGICKHVQTQSPPEWMLGALIHCWVQLAGVSGGEKNIFRVWYNNKNISRPFPCHWGAGRDGLQQGTLDDVF